MSALEAASRSTQAVAHNALGADLSMTAGLLILLGAYALVVALLIFTARCRSSAGSTSSQPVRTR